MWWLPLSLLFLRNRKNKKERKKERKKKNGLTKFY
jgi:hypothetical protein